MSVFGLYKSIKNIQIEETLDPYKVIESLSELVKSFKPEYDLLIFNPKNNSIRLDVMYRFNYSDIFWIIYRIKDIGYHIDRIRPSNFLKIEKDRYGHGWMGDEKKYYRRPNSHFTYAEFINKVLNKIEDTPLHDTEGISFEISPLYISPLNDLSIGYFVEENREYDMKTEIRKQNITRKYPFYPSLTFLYLNLEDIKKDKYGKYKVFEIDLKVNNECKFYNYSYLKNFNVGIIDKIYTYDNILKESIKEICLDL